MARLRVYTVHVNPSLPHPYEEARFVSEGFSFRAFLFTSLWALYHRLWWQAALLFAYNYLMLNLFALGTLSAFGLAVIDIGVHALIAFEANEWLRAKLKRQGYLTVDIATGNSPLGAEQRFFDRYLAAHPGTCA